MCNGTKVTFRFIPPFAGRGRPTSAGFAARMAGKPLPEMLTLLSSQSIPLTGNNKAAAGEAFAEMRNARDWLAKPPL